MWSHATLSVKIIGNIIILYAIKLHLDVNVNHLSDPS
uniref:Bm123 n=1 Tax=Brugia malayi TaxID=6279 RepID=A0A1I9FZU2_BRUMA|nr:Bm123 [Brugia malayi]